MICISIRSQNLPELMAQIDAQGVSGKTFALCMKGIEVTTLDAFRNCGGGRRRATTLPCGSGRGMYRNFSPGVPNCMVIDSSSEAVKERLISQLSGGLPVRFYYGTDLIGNEVGAAAKNVIGIAAGMLDGMGPPSLRGADEPRHAGGFPG